MATKRQRERKRDRIRSTNPVWSNRVSYIGSERVVIPNRYTRPASLLRGSFDHGLRSPASFNPVPREPGRKPQWMPAPMKLPSVVRENRTFSPQSARVLRSNPAPRSVAVPRRIAPVSRVVRAERSRARVQSKPLAAAAPKSLSLVSTRSITEKPRRDDVRLKQRQAVSPLARDPGRTCKPRPRSNSGSGGSRAFVPWCDRHK